MKRSHEATFKAQVAVAAVKGPRTLYDLAEQFSGLPTQIAGWMHQPSALAAEVVGGMRLPSKTLEHTLLHAKIDQRPAIMIVEKRRPSRWAC